MYELSSGPFPRRRVPTLGPRRRTAAAVLPLASLLLLCMWPLGAAGKAVGEVEFARGVAVAQRADGSGARLVGRGAELEAGEVVKTSAKSFAVLRLGDGTRMTLRPQSSFTVERLEPEGEQPSAIMRLFRGGLRAITGFISKRNPDGVRLHTPVVTMGVRGTEFDARLCAADCAQEEAQLAQRATTVERRSQVIGRVAFARGSLTARAYAGESRALSLGGPVYEGDTLETGGRGFAVLALRDRGRVTLQPGTEFRIDELRFDRREPERGSVLMRFLRGGLRVVSGLIGQARREAYRMRTPVATIGVRGTGYDLLCQGACASEPSAALEQGERWWMEVLGWLLRSAQAQLSPSGDGMFTYVWDGAVELELEEGRLLLEQDQAVFLSHSGAEPVLLPEVPVFIRENSAPRPDRVEIDEDQLFGAEASESVAPGLYVNVREGHLRLFGRDGGAALDLGRRESAFTGFAQAVPVRLELVPVFQALDRFPRPDQIDPKAINLLGRVVAASADEQLQCEVQ